MDTIKKVWAWLVYSSANANKYSLTLKGLLGVGVTLALTIIGLFHFSITPEQVNGVSDGIMLAFNATMTALSYAVAAVSAWAAVWGALRKIWTSATGTNQVIASFGE